jgi:cell division protein FtsI/penicillin-binding protein 2
LNTGTIFVQRLLGREVFREYVHRFGFGAKTDIELKSEVAGDIDSLERKGKVFAATASYGQGITTTPLQMVQAYAALGNGGKLVKPYIVSESIYPDGSREITKPQIVRQVIKPQSSRLITAMMVDVVEHGHGKRAGVPGYYVAGKTGTAQVSDPNGKGYLKDETIGSFAGFAPADHPAFVMLVKIDHPRTVQYAESSAAPIFGELSSFLLSYLQIPPVRPIKPPAPPSLPTPAPSTSTAR